MLDGDIHLGIVGIQSMLWSGIKGLKQRSYTQPREGSVACLPQDGLFSFLTRLFLYSLPTDNRPPCQGSLTDLLQLLKHYHLPGLRRDVKGVEVGSAMASVDQYREANCDGPCRTAVAQASSSVRSPRDGRLTSGVNGEPCGACVLAC